MFGSMSMRQSNPMRSQTVNSWKTQFSSFRMFGGRVTEKFSEICLKYCLIPSETECKLIGFKLGFLI